MRVRVDSVVAARGLVLGQPIEPGSMLATPRATLGGRRVKYFELPRKLMDDGGLDLSLVGFYLEDPADVAHFPLGAVVEYRDE